jgi:CshA-type fibril repeat protein
MRNIKNIMLLMFVTSLYAFAQVDYAEMVTINPQPAQSKATKNTNYSKSTASTTTIGNYVWFDYNQNGLQDLGELGLYNIEVQLFDNENCTGSAIETTNTTNVGYYEFPNIVKSSKKYCVAVVYPDFWTHTIAFQGNSDLNSKLAPMNSYMGKITNISLLSNIDSANDAGLHHKNKYCQVPVLNVGTSGVFDKSDTWAKRATLDVKFENLIASGYCHEYNEHGPLKGQDYSVHLKDRRGFTEGQRDKLSRIFRFMSDPEIVKLVAKAFNSSDRDVYFNVVSNSFVWYYSDWKDDFSRIETYINQSSWSKTLTTDEKLALKDISQIIIDKIEGRNGRVQYEPMKVYYLWNEDTSERQDIIVPETLLVPNQEQCVAPASDAKIGNFVWFDADRNGKQDNGESGVQGVKVELFNANDDFVARTTTDAKGFYAFTALESGEYSVKFTAKEGWALTTQNAEGVSDELNSDADVTTGKSCSVMLHNSAENLTLDAGMYIIPKPSIEIRKITNSGNVANILVGDIVTWTYIISNTGNRPLTGLVIVDDKEGSVIDCKGDGSVERLNPTKSITCTKVGTAILGAYSNEVTVIANAEDVKVSDSDSSSYVGKEVPVETASVTDVVWLDANRNGIQDSGELPLSGITVQLFNENRQMVLTTKTDASGKYVFNDVMPGKYYVKFTVPSGYTVTEPSAGNDTTSDSDSDANGKTELFTLVAGQNKLHLALGVYPSLVNMGDRVWFDKNTNGIQEAGESRGVAGVTVKLYNEDNTFVRETKTTTSGKYLFRKLTPGNYYVQFVVPNNYKISPKNQGNNESDDSDADVATGKTDVFTLLAGRDNPTVDMGLFQETTKVGDRVFYDSNKNGIQDNGESGVKEVTVSLYRVGENAVVETTKTTASGIYLFKDVVPGEYYIVFTAPAGYSISESGKGTDATDSNPDETGRTENFTLVSGTQNSTIDMGVYQNAVSFGDRVFLDSNHNGLQDIGEQGVRDVNVTLYSANSDLTKSMLTDENGNYLFTHLPAGEYSVEFRDIPYGHLITEKDVNNNNSDSNDSDGFIEDEKIITEVALLRPGKNDLSWDLGIYKTVCLPGKAVLGNLVWEDFNKDGVQDIGERGVKEVFVTLFNNDTDEKVASTKTDENGLYEFPHLDPEFNYYVQFTVPAGYVVSPQDQDDETIDSDADATGKTDVITLTADQINSTVDMGIYHEGSTLGDRVWFDELNAVSNGIQEVGEQGAFDVKVTLYAADGTELKTTRTNASGEYHFTNVSKGRYTIGFSELPNGYVFTRANQGSDEERDSNVKANGRTEIIVVNGTAIISSIDAGLKKLSSGTAGNDRKNGVTGKDVTLDVLANDVEGTYNFDARTVKITSTPDGATLSDDGKTLNVPNEGVWRVNPDTGAITFTPANGFVGDPTPISYTVEDSEGNEVGADVEVNYPPLAKDDMINAEVGKQVVMFVLENDAATSSPLDKASLRLIDPVTGDEVETLTVNGEGTWTVNVDASITFTPEDGFVNNPTSIQYVVREIGGDLSNPATVSIIYPDAVDDMVTVQAGHEGSTTVNVAENDSNNTLPTSVTIGCEQLGVQSLTVANEGVWNVNDDGTLTFTPENGFMADPTDIQYTIGLASGERSNCATVDIRHELLAVDDVAALNVGGISIVRVLNNDFGSINSGTVKLVIPNNPVAGTTLSNDGKTLTVPGEGVWTVNDEGVVTFTAEDGFTQAPRAINYTVENGDGTRSNVASITLTEGGITIVANDDTGAANGGEPVVINVLRNDTGDLNHASVRFLDANGNEVQHLVIDGEGTWTVNDNGIVTFTGNSGYRGTPTPVRYVVYDTTAVLSDTALVRITGECNCEAYESSIPAMGQLSAMLIVLLTMLMTLLVFRNNKFLLVK